jgi:uncharacterized protein YjiS (DUF1127 family)
MLQSLARKLPKALGGPVPAAGERRWAPPAVRWDASGLWREAYAEWRHERDLRAISRSLGRLSDRQLRLIGMRRETLNCDVEALADRARASADLAWEVRALLDPPARLQLPPAEASDPPRRAA